MLWVTAADVAQGTAVATDLPRPVYTRQTLFGIPFRMASSSGSASDPVQVLLFVSANRGGTWELNGQTDPQKGQFLFRAGSDGEFWFIIRTAIQGNFPRTPRGENPGLRVIVDTTPPKFELAAERGGAGQFLVRWKISEQYLNPESLKIQYRTAPEKPWQSVDVSRSHDPGEGPESTGEATWWQPGELQRIEIRGEVSDQAGNTAVSHAQIPAIAGVERGPAARSAESSSSISRPPVPPRDMGPPTLNAPASSSAKTRLPISGWRAVRRSATQEEEDGPRAPALAPIHPPFAAQGGTSRAFTPLGGFDRGNVGTGFRVVAARTFVLEYDVDPGAGNDGQPEVWGTRDGGRTWLSFATDPDRKSPVEVTVDDDGVFGFRIVLRPSDAGASQAPRSGTPPDIWVVVRTGTSPDGAASSSVQILDARPAAQARPSQP